ncbi:MAG TPA: MBL fold metallo-hydrolase [Chloroflexi bacterium]|nr:MBL fold metallo-hydrolase [Chloroflexota bacterium]
MAKLVILGSANAISDPAHENTHMALLGKRHTILIDCVSNPLVRLQQANVDHQQITDVILTHFHPDHVSGVPLLLMNMWLLGRKTPLNIYGLHHTLQRVEALMDFYEWSHWPDFFPVVFHHLPERDNIPVLSNEEFRISAWPVRHLVPTIGLRVEFPQLGKVLAYSCDTEPCPEVVEMAGGADVLIHEASGATTGHSSAAQAGGIARQAEAGRLYLIHYPTRGIDPEHLVAEAKRTFGGEVALAEDFMTLEF